MLKIESKDKLTPKYNVLVVDDDEAVRHLIECLLGEPEYSIHQAGNGTEAIEILKRVNVDLIILDLLLPGKHGLDICSIIRGIDKFRNIPIMIITAVYTKSRYYHQSREYGADAFVTKPFEVDTFISQVSRLLKTDNSQQMCLLKQN